MFLFLYLLVQMSAGKRSWNCATIETIGSSQSSSEVDSTVSISDQKKARNCRRKNFNMETETAKTPTWCESAASAEELE